MELVLRMVANDGSVMNINPLWHIRNISAISENGHEYEIYRNPLNWLCDEHTTKVTIKPTERKDIESCICCGAKRPEKSRAGKIIQNATSGEMIYICDGCGDLDGINTVWRSSSDNKIWTYPPVECNTDDIEKLIKSAEKDIKRIKHNLLLYKIMGNEEIKIHAKNLRKLSKHLEKNARCIDRETSYFKCMAKGL
jgi:hypothetical protein